MKVLGRIVIGQAQKKTGKRIPCLECYILNCHVYLFFQLFRRYPFRLCFPDCFGTAETFILHNIYHGFLSFPI